MYDCMMMYDTSRISYFSTFGNDFYDSLKMPPNNIANLSGKVEQKLIMRSNNARLLV